MEHKYSLRKIFANMLTFIAVLCVSGIGFCQTPDELTEEGKTALINNLDIYAADAKFAEALAQQPSNVKANFWRAMTIIFSNADLKAALRDFKMIGDNNDGNQTDGFLILDQEGNKKFSNNNVDTAIIDNRDINAGYSESGSGWETFTSAGSYGDNCRLHPAGTGGNIAIWRPAITVAGQYDVFVWWPYANNNTTNAEYTVHYENGSQTIYLNQKINYQSWVHLGRYRFSPGVDVRIVLSDYTSNGQVAADAIKLVFEGDYISEKDAVLSGSWQDRVAVRQAFGGAYKEIALGEDGTCTWRPNIPNDGIYQVFAYWPAFTSNAANATFTVTAQGGTAAVIRVNQQRDGFKAVSLGIYQFKAGTGNIIELSSQGANGKVASDGINIIGRRVVPDLSEIQTLLNGMLTQTDQALAFLDNLSNTFVDSLDLGAKDASGNPVITEIDYGDVLVFKVWLNLVKEKINIFQSYDMNNINPQELAASYRESFSINSLLDQYFSFGNLLPEAATRLPAAKSALIASINACLASYEFMRNETEAGSQDNDLITLTPQDIEEIDKTTKPKLLAILENLNGGSPFIASSGDLFDTDIESDLYFKTPVNLRAFFDNPKDLKAALPQFDNSNNILRSSAPDPTLGGILPEMTQAELNGIMGLGSVLSDAWVSWNDTNTFSINLSWEKDKYADFVSYKIYRSTTEEVNESSPKVFESTNKNIISFIDSNTDKDQRVYYYRLYTYYVNGDKIVSPIKRVITKIFVNATASKEGDGSPQMPYEFLRDGVEAAENGAKVCVAGGTYVESEYTLRLFNMRHGIFLEGGYDANSWSRNINAHPTIIDGTGLGSWQNIIGLYNLNKVVIDGFSIQGAGYCGINLNRSTGVVIRNCIVKNNRIGIGSWHASSAVKNCVITENSERGIVTDNSSITLTDCEISRNLGRGVEIRNISTSGTQSQILNCAIKNTVNGSVYGIFLDYSLDKVLIKNNLLEGNGIACDGNDSPTIINNSFIGSGNSTWAMAWSPQTIYHNVTPTIRNNIITGHNTGIVFDKGTGAPKIDYNNVWGNTVNYSGCSAGAHDISVEPLFVFGPLGNFYLSQVISGQGADSFCVNSGSDTAENLGLNSLTTRTDELTDSGIVDLGYHYLADYQTIITLTQPNGGEIIRGGSPYEIKWSVSGSKIGHIRLLYSLDGGLSYSNVITTGSTNTGVYNFTVPNYSSNSVKVKAIAEDSQNNLLVEDESDTNFTIDTDPPTGTIKINNDSLTTNSASVILNLDANDTTTRVIQMQFSNDNIIYSNPEAYAATKLWTLAVGIGEKTAYVKFKDAAGNWSTAISDSIIVISQPDLVVTDIKFYRPRSQERPEDEITPAVGQLVICKAILNNQGNSGTGVFNVKWYVDGIQRGYGSHSGLANGAVSNGNVRFDWLPAAGSHTLRFIADCDNHAREANESNNEFSKNVLPVTPILPDLVVTGIKFYRPRSQERPEDEITPAVGQLVVCKAILHNTGDAPTGVFNVKWFLNGSQVGYGSHSPLDAGTTSNGNVRFNWVPTTGSHTLSFAADTDNHTQETNENNNNIIKTVDVNAQQLFSISGRIYEGFGPNKKQAVAAFQQANVTLSQGRKTIRKITADKNGYYRFEGVSSGAYEIAVNKQGYRAISRKVTPKNNISNFDFYLRF